MALPAGQRRRAVTSFPPTMGHLRFDCANPLRGGGLAGKQQGLCVTIMKVLHGMDGDNVRCEVAGSGPFTPVTLAGGWAARAV